MPEFNFQEELKLTMQLRGLIAKRKWRAAYWLADQLDIDAKRKMAPQVSVFRRWLRPFGLPREWPKSGFPWFK